MEADGHVRQDDIRELQWDPQVSDPDAITVAVQDGAVTWACARRPPPRSSPRSCGSARPGSGEARGSLQA